MRERARAICDCCTTGHAMLRLLPQKPQHGISRRIGSCYASRPSHSFSLASLPPRVSACGPSMLHSSLPPSHAHFVLSRIDFDRRPDVRACVLRLARSFSFVRLSSAWWRYASFSMVMRACLPCTYLMWPPASIWPTVVLFCIRPDRTDHTQSVAVGENGARCRIHRRRRCRHGVGRARACVCMGGRAAWTTWTTHRAVWTVSRVLARWWSMRVVVFGDAVRTHTRAGLGLHAVGVPRVPDIGRLHGWITRLLTRIH